MSLENASDLTQEELEEGLQIKVAEARTWCAKLPFDGLVDYDGESADLFSFVTNAIETRAAKFDPKQWPPTKKGLKDLLHHLKVIGLKHGSEFIYDVSKGWLACYRSKPYHGTKLQDSEQYNEKGVLLQYRHKSYPHDRLRNRPDGLTQPRATHTSKDTTGDKLCPCRLRLRIHKSKKASEPSYIYVSCTGSTVHRYHAKPAVELPIKAHTLTKVARQAVIAQQKAAVTGTQSRKMLLELKHGYVSIPACPRIPQQEDVHSIVHAKNVANLSVDKLAEGSFMVSRDRNRSLFLSAQQYKQRAKVLSQFSQSRTNKIAAAASGNTNFDLEKRRPAVIPIVSPPLMGRGGLAARRTVIQAAAAPMIRQQFCHFTSTLTVDDQLTRTEFIHERLEAIEAKAIKAASLKLGSGRTIAVADSSNVELLNSNEDACLPQQKKSGTDGICGVKETMATKQQAPRGLYSISNVSIEQKEKNLFARSH
ncbi:unnamed protein product [Cylindrotheca closterium]|uniref:Uncharacterized protein n=1 Tax=Cylindrotheca closterium TaxID=2856 RepID=A0AAD2FP74_9STRA|nr:unnamed protein product [Cylindrotheca closterium]